GGKGDARCDVVLQADQPMQDFPAVGVEERHHVFVAAGVPPDLPILASSVPSGVNSKVPASADCRVNRDNSAPVRHSQRRISEYRPVARTLPSGENATPGLMPAVACRNLRNSCPVTASQRHTASSLPAAARTLPSAEKAIWPICPPCRKRRLPSRAAA